jgi:hypothetical protein
VVPPKTLCQSFTLPVSFSKGEVQRAIEDECIFVQWCVYEAGEVGSEPSLKFDVDFSMKDSSTHDIMEAEFKFNSQFGPSLTACAREGTHVEFTSGIMLTSSKMTLPRDISVPGRLIQTSHQTGALMRPPNG